MAPFQRGAFFAPLIAWFGFSPPASPKKEDHARFCGMVFSCPAYQKLASDAFSDTITKSYLKEVHKLKLKYKLQTPAPAGKKPRHLQTERTALGSFHILNCRKSNMREIKAWWRWSGRIFCPTQSNSPRIPALYFHGQCPCFIRGFRNRYDRGWTASYF